MSDVIEDAQVYLQVAIEYLTTVLHSLVRGHFCILFFLAVIVLQFKNYCKVMKFQGFFYVYKFLKNWKYKDLFEGL